MRLRLVDEVQSSRSQIAMLALHIDRRVASRAIAAQHHEANELPMRSCVGAPPSAADVEPNRRYGWREFCCLSAYLPRTLVANQLIEFLERQLHRLVRVDACASHGTVLHAVLTEVAGNGMSTRTTECRCETPGSWRQHIPLSIFLQISGPLYEGSLGVVKVSM